MKVTTVIEERVQNELFIGDVVRAKSGSDTYHFLVSHLWVGANSYYTLIDLGDCRTAFKNDTTHDLFKRCKSAFEEFTVIPSDLVELKLHA